MDSKITAEETKNRQLTLTVEVDEGLLDRHLAVVRRKELKRLKLPGFRKGKVPDELLDRYISQDELVEDAVNELAGELIGGIVEERSELRIVGLPRIKILDIKRPVKVEVTFALKPTVDLGEYQSIKLPEPEADDSPPLEEEVDKILDQISRQQGKWQLHNDPIAEGDLVVVTVDIKVENRQLLDWKKEEIILSLGNDYPLAGFGKEVVGMRRGERRQFRLTVPEGHREADLVGKSADVKTLLHSSKILEVMELTDEVIAEKLGDPTLKTMDDLKARLRANIQQRHDQERFEKLKRQVTDALVDSSTFEIPDILVDDDISDRIKGFRQELKRAKMDLDSYLKGVNKSSDEFVEELRVSSLRRVQQAVAINELINVSEVEISDDVVEGELAHARSSSKSKEFDEEKMRDRIKTALQEQAAIRKLLITIGAWEEESGEAETKVDEGETPEEESAEQTS